MKNSLIISFISNIFSALAVWFENSVYYRILRSIMDFFGRLYDKSLAGHIFVSDETKNYAQKSALKTFIGFFVKIFESLIGKPLRFLSEKANESQIGSGFMFLLNNWQYISIRYYAVCLFAFGCVSAAAERAILGFISNRWYAAIIVGIIGFFINTSVSFLAEGEFFLDFFEMKPFKKCMLKETKPYFSLAVSIGIGAAFGAMYLVPHMQLFIVLIIAFVALMLKSQYLPFFAIVFLPFLPTMAVLGLSLFAVVALFVRKAKSGETDFNFDGFDIAALGMVFVNIFGVLNSETKFQSAKIAAVYIGFILFFFAARRFLQVSKNFFVTLDCFIVSATGVAAYGIAEQIFGLSKTTWQDEEMFEEISGRVCSTFENPNVLGEFFLLTIPLTASRLFTAKNSKSKIAALISLFLQLLCLVFTYSRGCWIGIIFSMGLMLALCAKRFFVFMTLGIFAVPFVVPQTVIDRLLSIGNTADTSTAYRVFIWQGTYRMLRDTFLTGIGLGSDAFNSVYPRYALGAISAPHPHNLYLLILSETGVIGMLLFAVTMILYFKFTGTVSKKSAALRPVSVSLAAGMGGFLLQGMFDNVWYNYRIYALFFVILAFAAALKDISKEGDKLD